MDINTFTRFAPAGKCPICGNTNLSQFTNSFGKSVFSCGSCGGVPAYCNGTLYVHSGNSTENCERCGEQNASANTHAILMNW